MEVRSWLISIFAVAVILEIVLIILPSGKTGKYIKGIFLLVFTLVILQPIVGVKDKLNDYRSSVNENSSQIYFQDKYLDYVTDVFVDDKTNCCKLLLEECGIKGSEVEIEYIRSNGVEYKIQNVRINLKNAVIIGEDEHINIIEKAKRNLCEYLEVKDEVIIFCE